MAGPAARRQSVGVNVGGVMVGGGAPVVMQLARAGSEIVRITVDRDESAAAVPIIRDRLASMGYDVPLVGDFHYIGHKLLTDHPACAEALAKYRINPGNVGFKAKRDTQFATLIEIANRYDKPVRIGVNWGSLDEELLTRLMDENAASDTPISAAAVQREAIIQSALLSAARAEELGMGRDKILLSTKVSDVQHLIAVYQPAWGPRALSRLRRRCASSCSRGLATPFAFP